MEGVVDKNVARVSTGEYAGRRDLRKAGFPHDTVNHKPEEYVRDRMHTNSIESFWSLLKRGITGSYHRVSKTYLRVYVNEFASREQIGAILTSSET